MPAIHQRLIRLTEPPRVGETYMVPTVWYGPIVIPVMGIAHSDPVLGPGATPWHVHIDQRFIDIPSLRRVYSEEAIDERWLYPNLRTNFAQIFVVPIFNQEMRPPIRERPQVCLRKMPTFAHTYQLQEEPIGSGTSRFFWNVGDSINHFGRFEDMYDDATLAGPCKVCPHRGIPLASIRPMNGIITCPGHLLDFDATTGLRVRRTVKRADGSYRHRTVEEGVVPYVVPDELRVFMYPHCHTPPPAPIGRSMIG